MEFVEMAKMTSKGQVTVPSLIREILRLKKGSLIVFKVTENGIFVLPGEIREKEPYSQKEWAKIGHLVAERGRVYRTSSGARKHVKAL
jgi:bifunctional DNA-binding transcriptional regulator/antitoxin component of YhaV-PrlF toxin-antitoxin module